MAFRTLLAVLVGAALALIAASGNGVLPGSAVSGDVGPRRLNCITGAGFIGIGLWTLQRA